MNFIHDKPFFTDWICGLMPNRTLPNQKPYSAYIIWFDKAYNSIASNPIIIRSIYWEHV